MRHVLGAAALLSLPGLSTPAVAQIQGERVPPRYFVGQAFEAPAARTDPTRAPITAMTPGGERFGEQPRRKGTLIVGGWSPSQGVTVGLGLFAVPKSATANPQDARMDPHKDPTGKTSRVAAVGMSFRF